MTVAKPTRLGIITPSSNTSVEPLTFRICSSLPNVSVHFTRFPMTNLSLQKEGLAQFKHDIIIAAAQLLAHAEVDVIGWAGTAAGWLGFEGDEKVCEEITNATGIPATTSTLALNTALVLFGVKKMGLVTPYLDDVQLKIVENYRGIGIDASVERHLSLSKNGDIGIITEDVIEKMVEEVVKEEVEAVSPFCTNWYSAHMAEEWENKYGVPVLDTVTTVVWDMLRICGYDATGVHGWGMIFQKA